MIQLIVPAQRGRLLDRMAQAIARIARLQRLTDQPIQVTHRPVSAVGTLTDSLRAALPDSLSLLLVGDRSYAGMMIKRQPGWQQLAAVAGLATEDSLLWVNSQSPNASLGQWVEAMGNAPTAPMVGGDGSNTQDHLLWRLLQASLHLDLQYVPYQGSGAASVQLVDRRIEAHVNSAGEEIENWRAGRVRPLCLFSEHARTYTGATPAGVGAVEVPSAAAQGVDLCYRSTYGVLAAADCPQRDVREGAQLLANVCATDDWQAFLAAEYLNAGYLSPAQFEGYLKNDFDRHATLLSGVSLQSPSVYGSRPSRANG